MARRLQVIKTKLGASELIMTYFTDMSSYLKS